MKLYVETKEKIFKYLISSKVEDSYLFNFTSNKNDKTITINSINNEWYISSNSEYTINKSDIPINNSIIKCNDVFSLVFFDETVKLYCLDSFDNDYIDLDISNVNSIVIGNNDNCNICIPSATSEIQITKENNSFIFKDSELISFLNFNKVNSSVLSIGDSIFICGTKIIYMGAYIRIIGIKPLKYNLSIYNKQVKNNTQYVPVNEIERNISLYDEDTLFFHTPQLKFNIQQVDINVDSPPEASKHEELPAIFTIGASLLIGLTSVITCLTSLISLVNKTATFWETVPSLAISLAMIIGSIILPIFSNRYQKKQAIKREKLRQEKYLEYLNEKKADIQNAITQQEQILKDNFLDLNSIIENIKTGNSKIWSKEITDKDFLTIRLGVGNKKANIVITAPAKQFSLDDDNLKESAIELSNNPLLMKDVPITASLIENNVFPVILECENKKRIYRWITSSINCCS